MAQHNPKDQGTAGKGLATGLVGAALGAAIAAATVAHNDEVRDQVKSKTKDLTDRTKKEFQDIKNKLTFSQNASVDELRTQLADIDTRFEEIQTEGSELSKSALNKLQAARQEIMDQLDRIGDAGEDKFAEVSSDIRTKIEDLNNQISQTLQPSS